MRKALLALLVVATFSVLVQTQHLSTGANNNVSGCVGDEYVCDPYLRQKVEPKAACSALNSEHCVIVANDYRSVAASSGDGTGEGDSLNIMLARLFGLETPKRVAANPDAWIGIYRCYHGPEGPCVNGLWPGFPTDTSPLGTSGPEFGFAAGSDPACAAGRNGEFGCIAMFFNRGGRGIIATRFLRDFSDESLHPIRRDPAIPPAVLVSGSAVAGKFADLCTIFYHDGVWHAGWTQFHRDGSHAWWSRSLDGGRTWSVPANISNPINNVQRVVFAADKRPAAAGGGAVHALFRTFGPNAYALATLPAGGSRFGAPVNMTAKSGPQSVCVYHAPSTGENEAPGAPENQFARAHDFASMDTGPDGSIYIAHTERINPDGTPLSVPDCTASGLSAPAAIVVAKFSSTGARLLDRKAIDIGVRCETTPAPGQPPTDVTQPGATGCSTGVPRGAGIQMQPVVKMNGGNLVVAFREGRGGLNSAGFFSGRWARMDIRAARLNPADLSLLATRQVSQYEFEPATGSFVNRVVPAPPPAAPGTVIPVPPDPDAPGVEFKLNHPFFPLHQVGTTPFMGDSDDLVAMEEFIIDPGGSARWATAADVPGLRMMSVWGGDTREAGVPLLNGVPTIFGPWAFYSAPGTGLPDPCKNPTIRFSNVFTSMVTGPVEAWAVQTFKPLDDGIRRTWPIVVRNRSKEIRKYRLTLVTTGPQIVATWDPNNAAVKIIGTATDGTCSTAYPLCTPALRLQPGSSSSLTVFGSAEAGANVRVPSPIRVLVDDLSTPENPDAIIRLNPNPFQYDIPLTGRDIDFVERHGRPRLTDPVVRNYAGPAKSPSGGNPSQSDPSQSDPSQSDPSQSDTSITDAQYVVTTGDTPNTTSGYTAIANFSRALEIDQQTDSRCRGTNNKCHSVQVIVSRTHTIPSVNGCTPTLRPGDEIIAYTPRGGSPSQSDPSQSDPSQSDPSQSDPSQSDPSQSDTTFTLTPASAPLVGASAAASYAAKAIASTSATVPTAIAQDTGPDGTVVGDPPTDAVLVTYRIVHHHGPEVAETAPTTREAVEATIGVVSVPRAERNKAGGQKPLAGNDAYRTEQTTPLTVGAALGLLRNDIGVIDDSAGNTVPLTAHLLSQPPNGTVTLASDGSFTYKPKGSFTGLDSFRYYVREGPLRSAEATVWITVVPKR